ncbi:DNA-binding transcriptional activator of the SARP family [Asanoa hainanensis]|uniref:DNA-binding transcriptional activator of the SARP family n=1 Tax=Asanoa hainanensis TaxID=560556 RepID=A0A239GZU4_9ACTN|nr:BTAD domain-containing putative transcriptional regulator [Asanoa hainanensis]SNS74422.1 DNA-binding transcriptional activator of the SARP family [Asanoa hainanensis]
MGDRIKFRLLGPVEVHGSTGWSRVERPRRRALFAYLLLAANRAVPARELSAALWGSAPPGTARTQLQNDVAALRRELAGILTRTDGYELAAEPAEVDERVFQRHLARAVAAAGRGAWPAVVRPARAALASWRGPALADVAAPFAGPVRDRLAGQRADAVELLAEARIRLGGHDEQIAVLRDLVDTDPERDRAVALLMLALVRAGRRTDALATARDVGRLLRDRHGLDPSWLVAELERRILRDDPAVHTDGLPTAPPAPVPVAPPPPVNQLPMDVALLTGRDRELAALAALADAADGPRVALVTGTAGVGKTALAVRFGHRHSGRFPGGTLFVDLRGYDPHEPPLPPLAALHRALVGLGVPRAELPSDVDEAGAVFRARTAARRCLVVLDNAGSAAQVRALLPGGTAGFVVVTSRDSLSGLLASHSVARVPLRTLEPTDGIAVLARVLGAERVTAEPDAAAELVELCGGLPLAIRIVAANLADAPGQRLDAQADLLRTGRLAALDNPGDLGAGVRSVLRSTYAALPPTTQRAFHQLCGLPFADLDVAALAGFAPRADLDRLRGVHLVEEPAPGRLALHDLPRAFGVELAVAQDRPREVVEWFGQGLDAASAVLFPEARTLLAALEPGPPRPMAAEAARAWLAAERSNLLRAVSFAHEAGWHRLAWRLAAGLRGYLLGSAAWLDLAAVSADGLAAAEADGSVHGRALHHLGIADAQRRQGDHRAAIASYGAALRLARSVGWRECQAVAVGHLGLAHRRVGELATALDCFNEDLRLSREVGSRYAQAVALGNIGNCFQELGRPAEALERYEAAAEIARETGGTRLLASAAINAGQSAHEAGKTAAARTWLETAALLSTELGREDQVAHAYAELSTIASDDSDLDDARRWWRLASDALERSAGPVDPTIVGMTELAEAALVAAEGNPGRALVVLAATEARSRDHDLTYQQVEVLIRQSLALRALNRADEAAARLTACLELARECGYHTIEARASEALAALPGSGRHPTAIRL